MVRGLAPLVVAAWLAALVVALGLVDDSRAPGAGPLPAREPAAAIAPEPTRADDRLPDAMPPPAPAPPPTPAPRSQVFAGMPVDASVPVFIPTRPTAAQTRLAIPNASAGYSPTITLTFDDCGDPANIGGIVDALGRSHRQALFFVTGQCRDHYPWLVGELKAAGHQVCNHTYSHPDLRRLSDAAIRAEIAGGVMAGCPYFRPPYGAWDGPRGRVARIAASFGLTVLLWDVDTRDWADADPAAMVAVIRSRGGVILFHLHGRRTLEAIQALDS